MKWDKDKSTLLSMICIAIFAAALLLIDIFGLRLIRWWVAVRLMDPSAVSRFMISLAFLSVFAWVCLLVLWRLLSCLRRGEIFIENNVRRLRIVSWCCAAAALICLISGLYYPPFYIAFAAAAFMTLIVRVVKNCFQQACEMKSELDLTV